MAFLNGGVDPLAHYLHETGFEAREQVEQRRGGDEPRPALSGQGKLLDDGESNEGLQHRIAQREKQLNLGKQTRGYCNYIAAVPKDSRDANNPDHVVTPRANWDVSKRKFDAFVRLWRRVLHNWDEVDVDMYKERHLNPASRGAQLRARSCLSDSDGSICPPPAADVDAAADAATARKPHQLSYEATPFHMPAKSAFADMFSDHSSPLVMGGASDAAFLPHLQTLGGGAGLDGAWGQALSETQAAKTFGNGDRPQRQAIRIPLPGQTGRTQRPMQKGGKDDVPPLVPQDEPQTTGVPLLRSPLEQPPHLGGHLLGSSAGTGSGFTSPQLPASQLRSPFSAWATSPPTSFGPPPTTVRPPKGSHKDPLSDGASLAELMGQAWPAEKKVVSPRAGVCKDGFPTPPAADLALLDLIRGSWDDAKETPVAPQQAASSKNSVEDDSACVSPTSGVLQQLRQRDLEGAYELLPSSDNTSTTRPSVSVATSHVSDRDPTNLTVTTSTTQDFTSSHPTPLECWDCECPCDPISGDAVADLLGASCFMCRKSWDQACGAGDVWYSCQKRNDKDANCAFTICGGCSVEPTELSRLPPLEPIQGAQAIRCWECDCSCVQTSTVQAGLSCNVCGVTAVKEEHHGTVWQQCRMGFHPASFCTFAVCEDCSDITAGQQGQKAAKAAAAAGIFAAASGCKSRSPKRAAAAVLHDDDDDDSSDDSDEILLGSVGQLVC
eukprot:TRINITY_DN6793_c0_g1_i1.p1 TRINITY_DN6793_c0_g1~~TRINITY_DN6793_c0_g1_i1.p1  ORF type:complete len:722 (+),score=227.27 TRINITY_DN6793_c0_g1_i1:123-2288(+)